MDLRSVLNTSDGGDRAPAKPAPKPQPPPHHQQQPHPQQQMQRPSQSPGQAHAPAPHPYYRDYNRQPPPHPSPSKPLPQEYPPHAGHPHRPQSRPPSHPQPSPHQPPPGAYPPQSPYQTPGPYPGRPVPPPLQSAGSFHDVRSPGGLTPGQSPYRASTTRSAISGDGAYPFPTTQSPAEMVSPVQRHQYSPAQYAPREAFPQGPQGVPQGHAPGPYTSTLQHQQQQQNPIQQQYLNQRPPSATHSAHSTPTQTPAQPQLPYNSSFVQSSPVTASRPPPGEHSRQPSQPATPAGPPLSAGSRQASITGGFAQPSSPYQQRLSYAAAVPVAQAQAQAQTQVQSSPPPPPPPAKRISSSYGSPVPDAHRRSQSHSERAPSPSVSPKTRVPSLQSNPDPLAALAAADARTKQSHSVSLPQPMAIDTERERAATPAKRKLEERDSSPRQEPEEKRIKPTQVNGDQSTSKHESMSSSSPAASSAIRKKRTRYPQPPVWAQDARTIGNNRMPSNPNFVLQKRMHSHINGRKEPEQNPRSSRHTSPETNRVNPPPTHAVPPVESGPQDMLGPWEPSITGLKPYEELSRQVADFLFVNVLKTPDMGEITSRGIQFEVEAKLGTLIDRDTNHRISRGVASECVLSDNNRVAFKSSMTELAHQKNNEFLNDIVKATHPRGHGGPNRVPVVYKHRREIDRFFELPADLQARIPGCVRSRLGRKTVRVRVTYDQKTQEVLGKIIKARVADLDIHFPDMPMDCRISINLEMDWDGTVEELEQLPNRGDNPDRNKDRLSYTQGPYQVDLTQVIHAGQGGRMEKEHELEIELNPRLLVDEGRKAASGGAHRYQELVEGFVDNIRVLTRKAREQEMDS
ncbi:CYTH-like domain-containing protein [Fusarium tricinctum]|uniref:mRNA-capping enzyme subunit beta n=1 Tax=Fusarium tricinctum TaxID=61284 RepID=A0A8K0WCR5_9HYPO|nr:CYTH-like domain-containing protein [Fusarium tricinctum]